MHLCYAQMPEKVGKIQNILIEIALMFMIKGSFETQQKKKKLSVHDINIQN